MLTEDQIRELSRRFQIDSYSIVREHLQLLFLKHFYELKRSEEVFFKGGTAIHFLFGSFRFSEDLDFTSLLPETDLNKLLRDSMKKLTGEVAPVELKFLDKKGPSLTGMITHRSPAKHPLTIRLEFSLREKPLTRRVSPIETMFPLSPYPLVVHMDAEEILAEKVRALLIRKKGRDLFDLWFLLSKQVTLREDYARKKMKWYRRNYLREDLIGTIGRLETDALQKDLNKFLPRHYRPILKELKGRTLAMLG